MSAAIFAGQETACKRTPGDGGNTVGSGHGEQFAFDPAVEQVKGRLLADESVESELLGDPEGLDDLPGRKGAGARIADLAGANEVVERTQGFVNGNG